MPRRSKRSKPDSTRYIQHRSKIVFSNDTNHNNQNKGLADINHIAFDDLKINYIITSRGTFNQDDEQFSVESRGVQCSCFALLMLCQIHTIFRDTMPQHLDDVVVRDNNL